MGGLEKSRFRKCKMQHDKMQHVFFDAVTFFDFRLVRSSLFTISNCWPSYSVSFPARPIFTFHHVKNATCSMTHAFWPGYIFRFSAYPIFTFHHVKLLTWLHCAILGSSDIHFSPRQNAKCSISMQCQVYRSQHWRPSTFILQPAENHV